MKPNWILLGALFGATFVLHAAFGAHWLAERADEQQMGSEASLCQRAGELRDPHPQTAGLGNSGGDVATVGEGEDREIQSHVFREFGSHV